MYYREVLKEAMEEKNITTKALAEQIGITDSYLSKIINGKKEAPKEEITYKIAEVLEINPRELILAGYLDRAPSEIRDFIIAIVSTGVEASLRMLNNNTEEIFNAYGKLEIEQIKDALGKINIIKILINILDNFETHIESALEEANKVKINEINPKTGEYQGYLKLAEPVAILISDNGMSPKIPKNSKVCIKIKSEFKNGDIVCLLDNETKKNIVRQLIINGDEYTFVALEKKYPPFTKNRKDVSILGEAVKVIIDL